MGPITYANFTGGIQRIGYGLMKKLVIADRLDPIVAELFNGGASYPGFLSLLGAVLYTIQLYMDFSGSMDAVCGTAQIFGLTMPENFRRPFFSKNISEFWTRWHITLGTWFRDYVYIPLGGNRKGKGRQFLNILIVWMLTGFWHGAAWNFLLWGLYFALLLMAEKAGLPVRGRVYTLAAVVLGFVLFDASSLSSALACVKGLFGLGGLPPVSTQGLYLLKSNALLLILAALGATPLPKRIAKALEACCPKAAALLHPAALCALLLICTAYLVDGSYNPFLYFRF